MYKISEFANMTGLSKSKIRFYEKNGLLRVHKDDNGYRYFTPNDAFRVNSFRTLLKYGFTIEEAVEMLNQDHSGSFFLEALKQKQQEVEREIKLKESRLKHIHHVVDLLEKGIEKRFEVITMKDFLYVRASRGLDFHLSKENEELIAEFTDLLPISHCVRIINKEDLLESKKSIHPDYAIAIPEDQERLLNSYDKSKVEYLNLGKCIKYCRENTREESESLDSFKDLFVYMQANNYSIRGDVILFPTFLNLKGIGLDIETLFVPIK
ncbi:MAG TPA: MerR family transcriptional regulator [Eubacteriaceae bacterium]|nr:MerR family transcriptional regulator [Eubacteriaceae bacterium]